MYLKLEYTDKEITPWGGMALMKKLVDHTGIQEYLGTLALPEQGSNRVIF